MGSIRGIKGQVKEHTRQRIGKDPIREPVGRKKRNTFSGKLIDQDCHRCFGPVRAPTDADRVTCGFCVQQEGV